MLPRGNLRLGPGQASPRRPQSLACVSAHPRGLGRADSTQHPANCIVFTEMGIEREGREPQFLEEGVLLGGFHVLRQTPSPPRDTGCPSIKWTVKHRLLGRPEAGWTAPGRSLGRASQGLQIQPFSCLANLMVPISFKTHTFPQALASSAQRAVWRGFWGTQAGTQV